MITRLEERMPGIPISCFSQRGNVRRDHVLSNRMPFIAMDPAFALLQIHRVGGQVPMGDGVAIGVEVESFLTDRGGGENKESV